ncbi:MAG: SDR family oxidoreductase [Rhodospirillaceae bacterium]|nr:SDR family oxidoreductase [Rhodospirillaceae bacterium]
MTVWDRFSLTGQTALITGAGRGLGRTCAAVLAEAGAHVVLAARSSDELAVAVEEITAAGGTADAVTLDVCDRAQVDRVVDGLTRLDVLVNNAGTNVPQAFLDVDEATFDLVSGINLKAAFFTAQAAARRMAAQGKGSIINMTSQAGHVALPRRSVYCATKFALEGLTKAMALDLKGTGVRANAVAPTFVETPMTRPFLANPEFKAYVDSKLISGRLASADDVALAVLFLASDASAMVNGTSLLVDGGWTAH